MGKAYFTIAKSSDDLNFLVSSVSESLIEVPHANSDGNHCGEGSHDLENIFKS